MQAPHNKSARDSDTSPSAQIPEGFVEYQGGCHCGAVRFSVVAPTRIEAVRCNCSICNMGGYLHLIVPVSRFTLEQGQDQLSLYTFNAHVAKHYFCHHCGIKPYYIPRSNPDGVDVNLHCLDSPPEDIVIVDFDGENWEANAASLAHKSRE